jgi:class 3 adenylate cyclase
LEIDKKKKDDLALYGMIAFGAKIGGYFFILIILSTLLAWSAPTPQSPMVASMVQTMIGLQDFFTSLIRDTFPKIAGGKYESGVYLIIIMIALKIFVTDTIQFSMQLKIDDLGIKDEFKEIKAAMGSSADARNHMAPMEKKMATLNDKSSRAELLKMFAETKKRLDAMVKDVTFLSIDVAGSTAMKEGKNKNLVQSTFNEYKNFVQQKMTVNGALKSAWTPDGVMICFPTADSATKCAKDLLNGLAGFNRDQNSIGVPFKVRCGVSAGRVHFDETTPMEEMSDGVIDLAGHMQKYADPDGIFMAKSTYDKLRIAREGFALNGKLVDNFEVYAWVKK